MLTRQRRYTLANNDELFIDPAREYTLANAGAGESTGADDSINENERDVIPADPKAKRYDRAEKSEPTATDADGKLDLGYTRWESSIYAYNLACFWLHLISAVLLVALTHGHDTWQVWSTIRHSKWVPVNSSDTGQSCADVQCMITVQESCVGKIPMEWLVVAFHACSVVAHLANMLGHKFYNGWLRDRMNPGRWVEYFVSASIMQVVIMVLTGYTDVWILSFSAVLIAVTQLFGHATEQYLFWARDYDTHVADRYQFFIAGWVSFLPPWIAVYYSFYWAIANTTPGPPDWVKAVVWTLVIAFASFAMVMWYYVRNYRDRFIGFECERLYCILSIVAKTILTWQLYFGIFSRTDRDLEAYRPDSCAGNPTSVA